MNKKILASWIIIAIVSMLLGAGTVAYFSDVETSSGNTFTAGTLDLQIRNGNERWGDGVASTWTMST